MIFTTQQANMILAGQKTRHTIPGSESRPPYQVGRRYPVMRNRQQTPDDDRLRVTVARVELTAMEFVEVANLDDRQARREGHRSRHHFLEAWKADHGDVTHGWTFSFELDRQVRNRFLTRPVAGRRGDYTRLASAAIDELPAVDEFTQERITADARKRRSDEDAVRKLEREQLDLEARLRLIRREAAEKDIDLSRQEQAIRERIKAMERKVRSRAA